MSNNPPQLEMVVIPCLSDNYSFLLHNAATGQTALVDAPEAAPIKASLQARGWTLTDILITHHHHDHIAGVPALRQGARVIGAAADQHRLPPLDLQVAEGDRIDVCGVPATVIDVPGHTIGHIAYHLPDPKLVFTADSLMALGCGRLFEGTAAQMWQSLQKLRALPADTAVCSGHEYTQTNLRFALSLDPDNAQLTLRGREIEDNRAAGRATVPSRLDSEMRTNPFLRADDPVLQQSLGMAGATAVATFAEIRARKDKF